VEHDPEVVAALGDDPALLDVISLIRLLRDDETAAQNGRSRSRGRSVKRMGRSGNTSRPAPRQPVRRLVNGSRLSDVECQNALAALARFCVRYHEQDHGSSGYAAGECPIGPCEDLSSAAREIGTALTQIRDREIVLLDQLEKAELELPERRRPADGFLSLRGSRAAFIFEDAARQLLIRGSGRSEELDEALETIKAEYSRAADANEQVIRALARG
jgi:hypothetical protein